MSLKEEGVF